MKNELPLPRPMMAGGEAEEEGDDEVLHVPILAASRPGPNVQRRPAGASSAAARGRQTVGGPAGAHSRMAIPQQKPVAARPKRRRRKRRARLEGQALPLGPRRPGRLAGPGLRLPPPPQAEAAATSAARARSRRARRPRRAPVPAAAAGLRPAPARRLPGRLRPRAGGAAAAAGRLRAGPRPGRAQLVSLGLVGAVQSLTRPSGAADLSGPAPRDDDGNPLAPADAWGHDHLWWLDRMVRTDQPLVERMALVFHDWFATSNANVSKTQQMIDQSNLFRGRCFGSFLDLFRAVTIDPAMLQWLNGNENHKWAPNENYAREMMELFSLGADRGAYSEDDIREQARALTGWRNDWSSEARRLQLPLRPEMARHRQQDGVRPDRQLGLGRRLPALRRAPPPPLLLRRQAVELLRPGAALGPRSREAAGARPTSPPAGRSGRCWRRS